MKQILTAEEMRDFMDSFIKRLEETFRTKAHGTAVRSLPQIGRISKEYILSIVRDIAITTIKNHIKNEEKKGKCIETVYIYL
jgi:TPP-dependent indolepyruvate ferredoxin oxidoreductase alpha subunit